MLQVEGGRKMKPNKNWTPQIKEAYNRIKAEMEKSCVELNIPMEKLQKAMINCIEEDNRSNQNYATSKTEKKPDGIIRRWLSSFCNKN